MRQGGCMTSADLVPFERLCESELALWRAWADDVRGEALDGGHFFPEEIPQRTAEKLSNFFAPPI